ncbi:hypothetical protein BH24BAC1_BH24BAC1_38520 [soil metagenome]
MTNQQTTAIVKRAPSLQPSALSESSFDGDDDFSRSTELQYLTTSALKQGIHVMAGPGAGKSRWLGRVPAWMALIRQEPLVVIDPTGLVIDNLLDKIVRLPLEVQQQLYPRLAYIDAGAQDDVVPTPLYYRQSKTDTLFEIANRLPSVFERQDPALANAPILGFNALQECAIYAGQIAAALGRQLDFVVDLIDHPGKHKLLLRELLAEHPELQPAVTYFRELMDPTSAKLREKRTGSFKNKLLPFLADPTMLATFAGTKKRLSWQKVIRQRKAVLIDLRQERDPDRRQFKMIWYLKTFTDYIKYRGMAGRGEEVTLILDEISDMLGQRTKEGNSILAEDLEERVTRLGRNFGVNVIVAHQNLSQLDERIQNVLMQMGTQIIGVLPNPDDAVRVARQFLVYDPYWVKKTERVWMKFDPLPILTYFGVSELPRPKVIDYKFIEFTPEEQLLFLVNKLQSLGRCRFLTKTATGEGDLRGALKKLSIERLDQNQYPNEHILAPLRRQLAQRDGVPVETLLAEIRANYSGGTGQKAPKKRLEGSATMEVSPVPQPTKQHDSADPLPVAPEPATPVSTPNKRTGGTRKSHA